MNVLKAGLGVMALASLCVAQDRSKAPENYGVEAALQSLSKMTVAEGLEVSLFAAEPMVQNPTAMDVDARGRVWITEAANYRKWANPPIRPEGDRVMTLADTDGDGRADKATVFYQDPSIDSALGIAVFGDEVIVSVAPNVFVLRDTDGDGKADQRRLLLTGTAGRFTRLCMERTGGCTSTLGTRVRITGVQRASCSMFHCTALSRWTM
jgi:glucose/arabinose dehydrogenase